MNRIIRVSGILFSLVFVQLAFAAEEGRLEIRTVDKATGQPIAARMHLKDIRGKVIRAPMLPFWRDHFVFDSTLVLEMPLGSYSFELECGPEYKTQTGHFTFERNSNDTKTIEMERFVDMKKEGWWSGDLHIHRPPAEIELLMKAEDLHVGPVMTWWNNRNEWKGKKLPAEPLVKFDGNRFYQLMAGEDEREGGALLYFNLAEPLRGSRRARSIRWAWRTTIKTATACSITKPGASRGTKRDFPRPTAMAAGRSKFTISF
jgi:hypothetical protein